MLQSIRDIRAGVKVHHPLIHCITNPISINQCANTILAVGARPIMAEHPGEVCEITGTAGALMLNLGNITDVRMESMRRAAQTAKDGGIPILLDAVGVACSRMRRDYACSIIKTAAPAVIKGNYSEINALYHEAYRAAGVDADAALSGCEMDRVCVALARSYRSTILASGKVDIVTDGTRLFHIKNGTPQLSEITGTGCMLGALAAAYLTTTPGAEAAAAACAVMGICGQCAQTERGGGSFLVNLMDALSTIKDEDIEKCLDMEEIEIEGL